MLVLSAQQGLLRVEHPRVVHGAVTVLDKSEIHRALRRGDAQPQCGCLALKVEEGHHGVLRLLSGAQHGLLVVDDELLQTRVLHTHAVLDTSIVEHVPAQRRAALEEQCVAVDQVVAAAAGSGGAVPGREADGSEERDARIKVRLGDTDACALGPGIELRPADVGPPAQQVCRNTDRNLAGSDRDRVHPAEHGAHLAGRASEQSAERVLCLAQTRLQERDSRLGAAQQGFGLTHVELGGGAVAKQDIGDLEAALLDGDVLPRDGQPLLEGSYGDVYGRDLGGERDQKGVVIGDRGKQIGVGRLDRATEPAPEIGLPGNTEIDAVIPVVEIADGRVGAILAAAVVDSRRVDALVLRIESSHGDAQLGARLEDAQARDLQRQILPVCRLDQPIEHGIVECRPPLAVLGGGGIEPGALRVLPVGGDIRLGANEIRPHHGAAGAEGRCQ